MWVLLALLVIIRILRNVTSLARQEVCRCPGESVTANNFKDIVWLSVLMHSAAFSQWCALVTAMTSLWCQCIIHKQWCQSDVESTQNVIWKLLLFAQLCCLHLRRPTHCALVTPGAPWAEWSDFQELSHVICYLCQCMQPVSTFNRMGECIKHVYRTGRMLWIIVDGGSR